MKAGINDIIELLSRLIKTPSLSRQEQATCAIIKDFLEDAGVTVNTEGFNVYASNRHFNPEKPTLLLNSHHDTVKPNAGYTRDPFQPEVY